MAGDWLEFFGEPEPLILSLNQEKGTNGGPDERVERLPAPSGSLQPIEYDYLNKSTWMHVRVFACFFVGSVPVFRGVSVGSLPPDLPVRAPQSDPVQRNARELLYSNNERPRGVMKQAFCYTAAILN